MDSKERFYRQFQASVTALQDQIAQLPTFSTAGGERQDGIDHILAGISRLSSEVADAADYVPAYDQRTYSQAIKALQDRLNAATAKSGPKQRFQFKPRQAGAANTQPDTRQIPVAAGGPSGASIPDASTASMEPANTRDYNAEIADPSATGIRKPSFSSARDVAIAGHDGVHIILPATAARAASAGSLADLRRCIVDMSGAVGGFGALAIRNVQRSLVVAGRVGGAAHITGVRDSVIVVNARQVRMHECKGVDVYLMCGTHPIIEDCKGVRVAPLPKAYLTDEDDAARNQWDQVDDFKWLKAGPSPNWSILPESQRLSEVVWMRTVLGGPGVGVDDVLGAVGIAKE